MSGDCIYFQSLIKELNPADTHSGDCCSWEIVGCDNNGYIEKIDLSNYNGITAVGPFPQTVAFFSHLKEFSIRGQQNINDIYSLNTDNLEKVDFSNSGMASANFPLWLYEAKKLREIDISNTKMVGLPQREFGSSISGCNFSNTPICGSYESSPFKGFIPEVCIKSCTSGGAAVTNGSSSGSSGSKTNNGGSTKVWPFILIGVIALLVLGALGFLFMKKKGKKGTSYEEYEDNKPAAISKKDKVEVEEEEPLEITVDDESNSGIKQQTISPFVSSGPPTPASDLENKRIEEEAINNYNNAYGGDKRNSALKENRVSGASAKEIYRQHNGNQSFEQDNLQTHPSIYNTMTTDNDSDDDEQDNNIVNQPIVNAVNDNQDTPALLRRQSSKKQSVKTNSEDQDYEPIENAQEDQYELYIANWDYTPTLPDELTLVAGDVIEITRKFDDGWCNGFNRRTNQSGIVPLCYLKEYED